jgi:hypothetical protein
MITPGQLPVSRVTPRGDVATQIFEQDRDRNLLGGDSSVNILAWDPPR